MFTQYIDKENKFKSLKYFILITIMPVVGIVAIFSYAFFHVQHEVNSLTVRANSLKVIEQIDKSVFDIQRLRGLTCISKPNKKTLEQIENINAQIPKKLISLKQSLYFIKEDFYLKEELSTFIDDVKKSDLQHLGFENLSQIINQFMIFSYRISHHYKLILEPELNAYILIDNIVYLLPERIEYNGQIRAVSSSLNDKKLPPAKRRHLIAQLDKIKEKLSKLDHNMFLLYKTLDNSKVKEAYQKVVDAQNSIFDFTEEKLLNGDVITFEPDTIFTFLGGNIDLIIDLYDVNLNILNSDLQIRLKKSKRLSAYIAFAALASIMFIVYINLLFYNKNKKFVEKIEKLTITDAMTSLYNRRYFDLIFENLLKTQKRTSQAIAFIMLDIDFFKQYNDTYGHQVGDEALKTVAKCLNGLLKRDGDLAFRLGGEEFGVLCTGLDHSQAFDFANSIRKCVEDEKIEHKSSSASQYVTISIGLVVVEPEFVNSVNDIYRYADEALYKAKANGRNQVCVHYFCSE